MRKTYATTIALLGVLLACYVIYKYFYSASHSPSPGDTPPPSNTIDSVIPSRDSSTKEILLSYFSPHNDDFITQYSGLMTDDLVLVNKIILLAQKQTTYTEEDVRVARDTYHRLFVLSISERAQDAPSGRANELIGTKLCIAKTLISKGESEAVKDCADGDRFPSDVEWSTDDITAIAQIVPYYLAGSHYFGLEDATEFSRYYLRQVVLHHEKAIEQWGKASFEEIAGEDYLSMVEDAQSKLRLLGQ